HTRFSRDWSSDVCSSDLISTTHEVSPLHANVLWSIRLPRVLMALVVGGALAVAGIVLQGVFRNPLAEPSLIGVSGGAVVGAMVRSEERRVGKEWRTVRWR